MTTIADFFEFIEANDISDETVVSIFDYNGQIHRVSSLMSSDPDPTREWDGVFSLISEDVAESNYSPGGYYGFQFVMAPPYSPKIQTVGSIRDFAYDDGGFFPGMPLVADLYVNGDQIAIDGFAIGEAPDNDYTYIVFDL